MRKNYQRKERKPNYKFEVVRGQEVAGAGVVADSRGVSRVASAGGRTDGTSTSDFLRRDAEPQVIRSCCSGGAADEIAVIH